MGSNNMAEYFSEFNQLIINNNQNETNGYFQFQP